LGEADERTGGDKDFFGETAVAVNAEKLAEKTQRFVAALAKFAFAAKEIGLDGDFIAGLPVLDSAAEGDDPARNFAAECARQIDGNGQAGRFSPEIDVIETAALDLNDDVVWSGNRIGNISQFEFSGCAVGDELQSLQTSPKSKVQSVKSRQWIWREIVAALER
jgi:hypothetical protein